MFYKSGSMLTYQERLKEEFHRSNLETQFGVTNLPKDNQMRALIGAIPHSQFGPVFKAYLCRLQRGKELESYRFQGSYCLAIDATQYYSSEDIHCSDCLVQKKRNGQTIYSHKALQPILCHPDKRQILPLTPEPIRNSDGDKKQDCEINAAKRLLPKLRAQHPRMKFIWLADSLYATDPFINGILEAHEDFIFRVKQGDHKHLFETIEKADYQSHRTSMINSTLSYRWYHDVPLNKGSDIRVTVIRAFSIKTNKRGEKTSTLVGTWATNLDVTAKNIAGITKAARARWKIENECFNALKNNGYDLTHNWGHVNGESFNFYQLIMLAFFIHQILELTDQLFQQCRLLGRTHKELWNHLSVLFQWFVFESWEHMLCFYIEKKQEKPPDII